MSNWPVTIAFTDAEAEALAKRAEADFDGDPDEAVRTMLGRWLEQRAGRSFRFNP